MSENAAMTKPPLEDPEYVPQHPPVDGMTPDVVAKWQPASQLRWFIRFQGQFRPQKHEVWERFFCDSESHRGMCCDSCIEDKNEGYGDDIDACCCRAFKDAP